MATITGAKLSFYRINAVGINTVKYPESDKDCIFRVHKLTGTWNDTTIIWARLDSISSDTILDSTAYTSGTIGWFDFDVTDAVISSVAQPSSNHGFLLRNYYIPTDNSSGAMSRFHSSESLMLNRRPKLSVTYTGGTNIISTNNSSKNPIQLVMQNNKLIIKYNGSNYTNISLFDIAGNLLLKKELLGVNNVEKIRFSSNLSAGMYIVRINGKKTTVNKKILLR